MASRRFGLIPTPLDPVGTKSQLWLIIILKAPLRGDMAEGRYFLDESNNQYDYSTWSSWTHCRALLLHLKFQQIDPCQCQVGRGPGVYGDGGGRWPNYQIRFHTNQLHQSFTSAIHPSSSSSAFWTQHTPKLKLPPERGLQFEKNAGGRYFALKKMVYTLNKLSRPGREGVTTLRGGKFLGTRVQT